MPQPDSHIKSPAPRLLSRAGEILLTLASSPSTRTDLGRKLGLTESQLRRALAELGHADLVLLEWHGGQVTYHANPGARIPEPLLGFLPIQELVARLQPLLSPGRSAPGPDALRYLSTRVRIEQGRLELIYHGVRDGRPEWIYREPRSGALGSVVRPAEWSETDEQCYLQAMREFMGLPPDAPASLNVEDVDAYMRQVLVTAKEDGAYSPRSA